MRLARLLSIVIIALAASAFPGATPSRSTTLQAGIPTVAATVNTGGNGPMGIGVDEARNLIYVAHIWEGTQCSPPCYGPNMVVKIDGNTLTASSFSSNAARPIGVAVDSADNRIIVVNNATEFLSVLNGVDGSVNSVYMGFMFDGYGAAFNASTGKAYVASYDSRALYSVTIPGGIVKKIDLPGNAYWVALDPAAKRAYVTMLDSFTGVAVVDTDADTYLGSFTGDYTSVTGIAVNTANGDVFAVSQTLGTVTAKDRNGTLRGFLTPGNSSLSLRGIAINPNTGHVFVTDAAQNLVHVFNAGDVSGENWVSPIVSLAVGGRPEYGIAVDVARGKVYVGNLNDGTVTVIDDTAQHSISLSTNSLAFVATPSGTARSQTVSISNVGASTLSWSVVGTPTIGTSWLLAVPGNGTTPVTLTVGVNTAPFGNPLAVGVHTGQLVLSSPGAINSPQTIDVRLSITNSIQRLHLPAVLSSLSSAW